MCARRITALPCPMAYVRPKVLDFAGKTPEEIAEIVASLDDATFNALAAAEAQMRQYLHFREFARAFWKIAAPETSEVDRKSVV